MTRPLNHCRVSAGQHHRQFLSDVREAPVIGCEPTARSLRLRDTEIGERMLGSAAPCRRRVGEISERFGAWTRARRKVRGPDRTTLR
jgi:hypothetical protein